MSPKFIEVTINKKQPAICEKDFHQSGAHPAEIAFVCSISEIEGVRSVHIDCSHLDMPYGHVYGKSLKRLIQWLESAERWVNKG